MRTISKYLVLFAVGGGGYYSIELLFRGYSHWSMFVLGGLCVILCGYINQDDRRCIPLWVQMAISSLIITALELDTGLICNVWLGMGVWDYSYEPMNFMGQICPLFAFIWFFLSILAIVVDDYIRYLLFGEEKPSYIVTFGQLRLEKIKNM